MKYRHCPCGSTQALLSPAWFNDYKKPTWVCITKSCPLKKKAEPLRIFSGESSLDMWDSINKSKNTRDLREALYIVCCRLQELEVKVENRV